METGSNNLIIENKLEEITKVAAFIEGFCERYAAAPDVVFKINLAVEEALVNTITHGFPEGEQNQVVIEIGLDAQMIVLTLIDNAIAFNPLTQSLPNVDASAEQREVGGLGVFLMRKTMDDVEYERANGQNRLTLRKRLISENG